MLSNRPQRVTLTALLLAALLAPLAAWSARAPAPAQPADLLVAAAASLSGLTTPLAEAFRARSGIGVRFNFGGSNTLARQIVEGARVDVFISADAAQMDVVDRAGRVVPGSRVNVIGNQLVVISRGEREGIEAPGDLAADRVRRLAMGDPLAVPAGVYGREWLQKKGLWASVAPKVVPLPTSPAAFAAVREGRADAGIVYRTDVAARSGVRVAFEVPMADAPPIVYPAAAILGGREAAARQFILFLQTDEARRVFTAAGFRVLAQG